jgi:type II secretory pathway component PulM
VELSPRQRRVVFAVIVIALAALGYYLVVPAVTHSGESGSPRAAASPTSAGPATAIPAASAPAQAPAVTAPAAAADGVNIYAWLPFTQQDLTAAASVAVRFSVDYDTFTYTESPAAYVGAMGGLITGQLATTLQAAYQTPGVAKLRASQKQVSTGTAVISSLRAFGPSSMTFTLTASQRLVTRSGTSNGTTQYAVTVTGSGSSWQVSDIELESAGNE